MRRLLLVGMVLLPLGVLAGLLAAGGGALLSLTQSSPGPCNAETGPATADLTNSVSPATATAGRNVLFTIVGSNRGPADAGQTGVRDPLPSGLTFVSASSSVGSCSGGATVTCTVGILGSGKSATITIL